MSGQLKDYKNYDDPVYYGPGVWLEIHTFALENDSKAASTILSMIKKFPCEKCRKHAMEYISKHPIEESVGKILEHEGVKRSIGLFVWTWIFHNNVNVRLGKPAMRLTDALMTVDIASCSEKCELSK